jgi:hypothetical protein
MNQFSMGNAWSLGFGFIRDNLVMCLILAAIGVIVPQVLQIAFIGGSAASMMADPTTLGVGGIEAMASMMGFLGIITIVGAVITYATYFAAWRNGLHQVGMVSALIYGAIAAITSLLAAILIGFILILPFALVLGGLVGISAGSGMGSGVGTGLFTIVLMIAWFLFLLWFVARTIAAGPWMADNASYNPFTGLANSWRMTGPGQWAIFGYVVLLFIAVMIITLIITAVTGLGAFGMMSGMGDGMSAASLGIIGIFSAVITIPLTLVYLAVPMGVYLNLREEDNAAIFG